MDTYFVKIALRGVSPMIWRRLRIRGNMSLADLHHIIQIAMGWNNDYLHCFHIYGEDYGIAYEGGMSFLHNAQQVFVGDFGFATGDRFTYTYNFTAYWLCDIRIERIEQTTKQTPWCHGGSGRQGANSRYYKTDEIIAMFDLLDKVVSANKAATLRDISHLIERYEEMRFSRLSINKQLAGSFEQLSEQRQSPD